MNGQQRHESLPTVEPHDGRRDPRGDDRSSALRVLTRALLAAIAPILAIAAYVAARGVEDRELIGAFREFASERRSEVERELARCLESLHSLRAFFDSSVLVEREEFASFTRNTVARRGSIQALEWAARVVDEDRPRHELQIRESGVPDYEIITLGEDGEPVPASPTGRAAFPVVFAEPRSASPSPLGLDLASDEMQRQALLRSAALGTAVMTPPTLTGRHGSAELSTIAFLAVRDEDAASPEYLESELRGVVLMVIPYRDLVACALGEGLDPAHASMRFRLLDVAGDGEERVAFDNLSASDSPVSPDAEPFRDGFRIGERTIVMVAEPTAAFLEARRGREPIWLAILTGLATAFAITIVWMHLRRVRMHALRQRDSLLRSVLTSLNEGVVVADRDGRVRFVNEVAVRALGPIAQSSPLDWPSVCGLYLEDGQTPCPVDHMPLVRAIRGERVISEHMFVRNESVPDGRWFGVSASPLLDERHQLRGGVVVLRDITQRRQTQGQLLRLSAAVQQTADAVMITDRDGVIVYVNRAFEEATGFSADEAVGRTPRILKSGQHAVSVYSEIWSTLLAGKVYRGNLVNRRRDGSLFESEQTITPIRDEFDGSVYFVSVAKDITRDPAKLGSDREPGRNGPTLAREMEIPQSTVTTIASDKATRPDASTNAH